MSFKFFLDDPVSINALLENFFISLNLSQEKQKFLLINFATNTLICALIYAIDVNINILNYDLKIQVHERKIFLSVKLELLLYLLFNIKKY